MYKTFDIHPFFSRLIVAVDKEPSKAVTRINLDHPGLELDYYDDGGAVTYTRHYKPRGKKHKRHYCVIVIDTEEFDPILAAHEAVHVVNYVMQDAGLDHDAENDEMQAYLTGWVVGKIFEVYQETIKPQPKKK